MNKFFPYHALSDHLTSYNTQDSLEYCNSHYTRIEDEGNSILMYCQLQLITSLSIKCYFWLESIILRVSFLFKRTLLANKLKNSKFFFLIRLNLLGFLSIPQDKRSEHWHFSWQHNFTFAFLFKFKKQKTKQDLRRHLSSFQVHLTWSSIQETNQQIKREEVIFIQEEK